MSDHNEIVYSTADGMDYPAHEGTYKAFIKMWDDRHRGRDHHCLVDGDFPHLIVRSTFLTVLDFHC